MHSLELFHRPYDLLVVAAAAPVDLSQRGDADDGEPLLSLDEGDLVPLLDSVLLPDGSGDVHHALARDGRGLRHYHANPREPYFKA